MTLDEARKKRIKNGVFGNDYVWGWCEKCESLSEDVVVVDEKQVCIGCVKLK